MNTADSLSTGQRASENEALARAGVFFLEEMYADALAVLEPLANSPTTSNLVYTALGDTYSNIGLNQLSIDAYDQALTLARASDDLLSEAIIRVNLADVYATLGLFDDALRQLRQARSAYGQLSEEPSSRCNVSIVFLLYLFPPCLSCLIVTTFQSYGRCWVLPW